jgi:hypothetical protein
LLQDIDLIVLPLKILDSDGSRHGAYYRDGKYWSPMNNEEQDKWAIDWFEQRGPVPGNIRGKL